jgi:Domain of unknown function (DUF1707)
MATGPGDELVTAGSGCQPVPNTDRERAIDTLKAAFVQGRLAKGEFDMRVGQALASQTHVELTVLTADLPAERTASESLKRASHQDGKPVLRPGPVIMAATALYAGVWPFTFYLPWPRDGEGDPPRALIILFFAATLMYLCVMLIAVGYMIASWREQRSCGQPLRRPAAGACD